MLTIFNVVYYLLKEDKSTRGLKDWRYQNETRGWKLRVLCEEFENESMNINIICETFLLTLLYFCERHATPQVITAAVMSEGRGNK